MEPRVTIHPKEKKIVLPKIPKEERKVPPEDIKEELPEKDLFEDEDLFEIDKVDVSHREFLEVISKEKKKEKEEVFLPVPEPPEELPEFKEVEEKKTKAAEISEEVTEKEEVFLPVPEPSDTISEKPQKLESIEEKKN